MDQARKLGNSNYRIRRKIARNTDLLSKKLSFTQSKKRKTLRPQKENDEFLAALCGFGGL